MSKRLLIPLLTVAAGLISATPALAATTQASASENWAGYVVTPNRASGFSAVSGSWSAPRVSCSGSGRNTYAAFWVGLGGGSDQSSALEQIGTQSDCSARGSATYYAWYELVPSAPVELKLTVKPGDKLSARVQVSGDAVTLSIADHTSGQSWGKTLTMSSPDTSTAEWIAEAPSECAGGVESQCTPLSLANFGTATFTNAHATAGGHTGSISSSAWTATRIELTPSDSSLLGAGSGFGGYGRFSDYSPGSTSKGAAPTTLKSSGTSFTVKYGASLSVSATSGQGTTAGDGGYPGGGYGGYGYGYSYGYGGYGGYYGGGYGGWGGY